MSEKNTPPLYPAIAPLAQDGLRPSIDIAQSDRETITRLQTQNLFGKLVMLKKELEHYRKLKRRWNRLRNVLHYLKYPVGALMLGGDALLFATGVGAPIAVASSGLTLVELVASHLVEDSLVRAKINKYAARVTHLKDWIDRMYVFKSEALRDQVLDQKEIELWHTPLNEFANSEKQFTAKASKHDHEMQLKRLQEQMATLVARLDSDGRRSRPS